MNLRTLLLASCLVFASNSFAETSDKLQFEHLSWLTGCWKGTGLGGEVEECWMHAAGEKMLSVFQMTKDGQLQFSEIVTIADFGEKPGYRVKHFDPDFNQWARDGGTGHTFDFIEMGDNYIQFDGLRYELIDDSLQVTVDIKEGDEIKHLEIVYKRY